MHHKYSPVAGTIDSVSKGSADTFVNDIAAGLLVVEVDMNVEENVSFFGGASAKSGTRFVCKLSPSTSI